MPLKLFIELINGTRFHFGDNPDRDLIKDDRTHYVAPEGRHSIHPHVAVIQDRPRYVVRSIWDRSRGEPNERE